MPKRPYPHYQRRHRAILLAILENPALKQKEIAKATGYSESQVSRILCSPEFKEIHDLCLWETARDARSKWLSRLDAVGQHRQVRD
jgi:predicted XRE-type DNA-binding protein